MKKETFTKDFFGKNSNIMAQFLRYVVVGGIAFLFDFSFLFIFTNYFHIHYLISAAIAFLIGLFINYLLSIFWVFDKRTLDNRMVEFFIFAIIGLIGLGLNEGFLWIFTGLVGLYFMYSKLISTFFVLLWNFSARKLILFR
jgi:putative flippase GtrA